MRNAPDVLFPVRSTLRKHLETIAWQEISVGTLDLAQVDADPNRAHVLMLASEEAQTVWRAVEERALDLPLYPLVVGDSAHIAKEASPPLEVGALSGTSGRRGNTSYGAGSLATLRVAVP